MPFSIRPYRRFPVQCFVTYNAGPFQGQGTVWNLSCTGGGESEARVAWEWQDTHVAPVLPERAPAIWFERKRARDAPTRRRYKVPPAGGLIFLSL